jgi:group I intron endonuclease
MVIYLFKFPNGKHYVGRTKNTFEQRLTEHKTRVTKQYQHPLYYAFSKYGWENVQKIVLEEVDTHDQAVLRELHYIELYDSLYNGYNLTINTEIGGDNWIGRRDTPEYEEFIAKMRNINNSGRMHGKSHSKTSKQKMKEKAKGRFSLPWYIDRYGEQEGTLKYTQRCTALKNRNLTKDPTTGRFAK